MKLNNNLYKNLTTKQRITLILEAIAREDKEEKRRLILSTPKKSYTMPDAIVTDTIGLFFNICMAVNCEIKETLLLIAMSKEGKLIKIEKNLLQKVSNLQEGLNRFVLNFGVTQEAVNSLIIAPSAYINLIADKIPEPQEAQTQKYCEQWQKIIKL